MIQTTRARVLVVEDLAAPRAVLEKILQRGGYQVQSAANAHDAVEIGEAFRPDLLLTDWLLPNSVSGLHVAERLREAQPDLPIIFLTGLPAERLHAQVEHVRPCRLMEKPCDFDELLGAIRQFTAA